MALDGQGVHLGRNQDPHGCLDAKVRVNRQSSTPPPPRSPPALPSGHPPPIVPLPSLDPAARNWGRPWKLCHPQAWRPLRGNARAGSPRTGRFPSGSQSRALGNGHSPRGGRRDCAPEVPPSPSIPPPALPREGPRPSCPRAHPHPAPRTPAPPAPRPLLPPSPSACRSRLLHVTAGLVG